MRESRHGIPNQKKDRKLTNYIFITFSKKLLTKHLHGAIIYSIIITDITYDEEIKSKAHSQRVGEAESPAESGSANGLRRVPAIACITKVAGNGRSRYRAEMFRILKGGRRARQSRWHRE